MYNVYKKELMNYLNNPVGFIILILFAVFANFLFVKDLFLLGSASLRPFYAVMPWLLMVFAPALAMRSIAEERRLNTLELLLTLPVSETRIVLAKFGAQITLLLIGLVLTLALPVALISYSGLAVPEIIVAYAGMFLIAASYSAVSLVFSALTSNQVVAFLSSVLTLFFLTVLSSDFVAGVLPQVVLVYAPFYSPVYHLQNFLKGVLDLRSFAYFFGLMVICMVLTITELERRG